MFCLYTYDNQSVFYQEAELEQLRKQLHRDKSHDMDDLKLRLTQVLHLYVTTLAFIAFMLMSNISLMSYRLSKNFKYILVVSLFTTNK